MCLLGGLLVCLVRLPFARLRLVCTRGCVGVCARADRVRETPSDVRAEREREREREKNMMTNLFIMSGPRIVAPQGAT